MGAPKVNAVAIEEAERGIPSSEMKQKGENCSPQPSKGQADKLRLGPIRSNVGRHAHAVAVEVEPSRLHPPLPIPAATPHSASRGRGSNFESRKIDFPKHFRFCFSPFFKPSNRPPLVLASLVARSNFKPPPPPPTPRTLVLLLPCPRRAP